MGPKFYACVPMSHDKKFPNCVRRKSGVSPLILPLCRSCRFLPMYRPVSIPPPYLHVHFIMIKAAVSLGNIMDEHDQREKTPS